MSLGVKKKNGKLEEVRGRGVVGRCQRTRSLEGKGKKCSAGQTCKFSSGGR